MTHLLAALVLAAVTTQTPPVNQAAAAQKDFQERLQAYVALRASLAKKLEPLSSTASASDLQARQQALAAAIRTARRGAKAGDMIPEAVQQQIRRIVRSDMKQRSPAAKQAAMEEVPEGPLPAINRTYPEQAALPTVPPLLLASLPRLPDNLQYRFFGRHMVLLDGDTELVIDYVRNALPSELATR
jgi:hypothetical protein